VEKNEREKREGMKGGEKKQGKDERN